MQGFFIGDTLSSACNYARIILNHDFNKEKRTVHSIEFSTEEKSVIVDKIKRYFTQELAQEIEQFDAEFLLDFFSKSIGPYYYNRGLHDAQRILESKLDSITESFYELEKTTELSR
jgi:uncharacterized protein (DUF2164 family)